MKLAHNPVATHPPLVLLDLSADSGKMHSKTLHL